MPCSSTNDHYHEAELYDFGGYLLVCAPTPIKSLDPWISSTGSSRSLSTPSLAPHNFDWHTQRQSRQQATMCYHKYTHFQDCGAHVPIHTHICPKNINEDPTRVIFCEDYHVVQLKLREACPFCTPQPSSAGSASVVMRRFGQPYPTPPKTATPKTVSPKAVYSP